MAKGLVGGVNTTTRGVTTSNLNNSVGMNGSAGKEETYTARITSIPAAPVEYVGVETDSMTINVDNANRTIGGEVKWLNMIASNELQEDAYHAYPANKARINFTNIENTLKNLQSNVDSLGTSCNTSVSKIAGYVQTLEEIQKSLSECQTVCYHLRGALDKEILAREKEHVELRNTDNKNLHALQQEISRVTTTTTERLDSQSSTIDKTKEAVTTEAARAKAEEGRIQKSLQSTNQVVLDNKKAIESLVRSTTQASNRLNALESSDVGTETSKNSQDIAELRKSIATTDLRLKQDYETVIEETGKLRDLQYKHESKITDLTTDVEEAKQDVRDIKTQVSSTTRTVDTLVKQQDATTKTNREEHALLFSRLSDESTIRRDTDSYHEEELQRLEVRISDLQDDLTRVIQSLADELRRRDEELQEGLETISFDFVDAGNAPI